MNERRHLPNTPILPEEREAAIKSGKPKLPGAPNEAHESLLLAIEEGLPLLDKVGGDLKSYATITKSEKKKDFKYAKIHFFLNNPKEFEVYFDTLRVLAENWKGREEEIEAYIKEFLDNLEKFIDVSILTPEVFAGWISLMAKSEIYKPIVERIIRTMLEKVKTPQALMSFMYNLAEALLTTDDKEVLQKGLEVIMLGAPFLDKISDRLIVDYMKAAFTVNDDETLRRSIEVNVLISYLGPEYAASSFETMQHRKLLAVELKEYRKFLESGDKGNFEKLRILNNFYTQGSNEDGTTREVNSETLKKWPYNLITKGGRVRELCNERVVESDQSLVTLSLPGRGSILNSGDSIASNIVEILNQPVEGNSELKTQKDIKALFYLSPEISKEKKQQLSDDVILLKREIYREKTHGISPRGDKMLISDGDIGVLGIKSFTFKVEEHAPSITAVVEVGNYKFILTIDQNFEMKDVKGDNLPVSFEQRAFMEHLVLSYLKELMCTERVKLNNGDKNGQKQIEREQEFKDRRPHLRKMAPNNAYSQEALAQGLMDPQRWDLSRINAELGFTKAEGQKTYVKVLHRPLPGEAPLESRAPHATDRLKKILAKHTTGPNAKDEK